MINKLLRASASAAILAFAAAGCATASSSTMPANHMSHMAVVPERPLPANLASNPAVAPWTGPYDGVPQWDKIKPADILAAFDGALALRDADIADIVNNPAPPTFENTIVALERSGAAFSRLGTVYGTFTSSAMDNEMTQADEVLSPKFAAAQDALIQNSALFARIEAVNNSPEKAKLNYEQQRLLWRTWDGFVRAGAKLDATQKAQLATVNQQLASLYSEFSKKVLADENTFIVIDSEADLAGLPDAVKAGYKTAASEKKLDGKWVISNTRSNVDPFLTYASNRALREKVWRAFKNRGDNGDANDTNATIAKIMPLRAQKAHLLGYKTYADWKLGDKMAENPENAMNLLLTVWKPTVVEIHEEVADMQAMANKEGAKLTIEPWDYLYYAEKVRKAKYDLDQNELKPYFELNKMIEASQWNAGQLYGLSFKEITGKVPTLTPDVRVWEVYDNGGKTFVGLFYGDYFSRGVKRSGAWENAYRSQSNYNGVVHPLVSNNNNFVKAAPGEPILISLDDASTLFHEFGHAIHDLVSNVHYESLAGTNVSTDFVEFPSQVHENWVLTPQVLNKFALHYKTGQPMPQALVDKVNNARKFNQGYVTGEYMASAIVDMKMHMVPDGKIDPDKFERETLAEIGTPKELVMRHRTPQFNHLFADEGYAAGYYSYLWSDTMGADAWAAFTETGNVYDPTVAAKMKRMMSEGDTKDQKVEYREFRGRDPDVNALLVKRGFPPVAK